MVRIILENLWINDNNMTFFEENFFKKFDPK